MSTWQAQKVAQNEWKNRNKMVHKKICTKKKWTDTKLETSQYEIKEPKNEINQNYKRKLA